MRCMLKRIFKWFFCNLFYYFANKSDWLDRTFGAKKKKRPQDRRIMFRIAALMTIHVCLIIFYIAHLFHIEPTTHAGSKLSSYSIAGVVLLILTTLFNRLLYRNKRYLKLMEGFSEENYNKYIIFISVFFFIVLPAVIIYLVWHKNLIF